MLSGGNSEWLLWVLTGVGLIAGVWLVWRALFRDRPRGRRRCPSCWYDFAAAPSLTCPECGKTAASERALGRTRRRYGRAACGVAMVLVSALGAYVWRAGWVGVTPTFVYAAATPWALEHPRVIPELWRRADAGEGARWEWKLLYERTAAALPGMPDADRKLTLMELFDLERVAQYLPYLRNARPSVVAGKASIGAMVRLLDDADADVAEAAMMFLVMSAFDSEPAIPAIPALLGRLDGNAESRDPITYVLGRIDILGPGPELSASRAHHFPIALWPGDAALPFAELRACGTDGLRAKALLLDLIESDDPWARAIGVWSLAMLAPGDDEVRERVLRLMDDPEPGVRAYVVQFAARAAPDEAAARVVARGVEDPVLTELALVAARAFRGSVDLAPVVAWKMHDPDERIQLLAARAWADGGGDLSESARVVMRLAARAPSTAYPDSRRDAFFQLPWCAEGTPEVLGELERIMKDDNDPWVRCAATYAHAVLSDDRPGGTERLFAAELEDTSLLDTNWMVLLARSGAMDPGVVVARLEGADLSTRRRLLHLLADAGATATDALPAIRGLVADPHLGALADQTRRIIEWELANPEDARRRRLPR